MKNKIAHLVTLQYQLNYLIDPDWIEKALDETYDYRTAASQEIAEALESLGYAWWTERPLDMQNVFTELVDAMHFILSQNIAQVNSACDTIDVLGDVLGSRVSTRYENVVQKPIENIVEVRKLIRQLQAHTNTGTVSEIWDSFFGVTKALNFTADHIYARYLAKSILNTFRQQNGYRTGQYQKVWDDGLQDNIHVANYVDANASESFDATKFLDWLQDTYKQKTKSASVVAPATVAVDPVVTTNSQVSPKNQGIVLANKRK